MLQIRKINENIEIGLLDLGVFALQQNISNKRELEKAGAQFLLKNLLKNETFQLSYTAENKPFLQGRAEHISISHSHDKLAIILNRKENTGIDIEQIRDKVINIQNKFLSQKELDFAKSDPETLITLWAAKEAMYKVYGLKEVEFIRDLIVDDYTGSEMKGTLHVKGTQKSYRLINERVDNYKMVYVLHEL